MCVGTLWLGLDSCGLYFVVKGLFGGRACCVLVLTTSFSLPWVSNLPSHTCIPVAMARGGAALPGGSGMQEMGTLWPRGHFGATAGSWRGRAGFCFCTVLPSLWASALHGGWKQEGLEGGGRRLGAACERFVLWCNQYSLILFDFFFSLLFVVAIFHVSTVSAVFSPYSRPPFPL